MGLDASNLFTRHETSPLDYSPPPRDLPSSSGVKRSDTVRRAHSLLSGSSLPECGADDAMSVLPGSRAPPSPLPGSGGDRPLTPLYGRPTVVGSALGATSITEKHLVATDSSLNGDRPGLPNLSPASNPTFYHTLFTSDELENEFDDHVTPSAYVAPLYLRRRLHRRSFSMFTIPPTDTQRDTVSDIGHGHPGTDPGLSLIRSHSHRTVRSPDTSKTYPRLLPKVPIPRPVSPTSPSYSSHGHSRPLPIPPLPVPPASMTVATHKPLIRRKPPPPSPSSIQDDTATATASASASAYSLSTFAACTHSTSDSEISSPLLSRPSRFEDSPSSSTQTIILAPKAPTTQRRVYASPYKFARNAYSTSSLSSQVSVPPVPSSEEIRKRNISKMNKLVRILGESPPHHLVFGKAALIVPESNTPKHTSRLEVGQHHRWLSADTSTENEGRPLLDKIKNRTSFIADAEKSPPGSTTPSPPHSPARLRRSRPKKEDGQRFQRVVSVNLDALSPSISKSSRLTIKTSSPDLRGQATALHLPPLPSPMGPQQWVREIGKNRVKVHDYEKVVKTLREL